MTAATRDQSSLTFQATLALTLACGAETNSGGYTGTSFLHNGSLQPSAKRVSKQLTDQYYAAGDP